MSTIDLPDIKATLWNSMRADLNSIAPWFADSNLLLCPTCCRPLPFDQFSIEHIIPKQALAFDPAAARDAIPKNVRSGLTLLCCKPLVIKGRRISGTGCNGWKGKHYDPFLRDLIRADFSVSRINSRGHVALIIASYLAVFRRFGYQISLLASGLLLRKQFFHPNAILAELPMSCQMILASAQITDFNDKTAAYWSEPFRITIEQGAAFIVVRNMSLRLPLSRDPTMPVAVALRYAPARFTLRPDLTTVFE